MNAIRKHATYFSRKNKHQGALCIEDFTETKIVLKKESTGLGISIAGGSDTYFGKILVTSINPESTAFKDGRLRIGDELRMVNGVDLRGNPHEFAVQQIRLAQSPVELIIFRENIEKIFTDTGDPNENIVVELNKSINESLGLGIYARKDGKGVFVTAIVEGSLASLCRQFQQGDQIIKVNDRDLTSATQIEATQCLRNVFGQVRIILGRNKQTVGTLQHFMYDSLSAKQANEDFGARNSKRGEPPFRSPRYRAKKNRPKTVATDDMSGNSEDICMLTRCASLTPQGSVESSLQGSPKKLTSSGRSSDPDIIDISVAQTSFSGIQQTKIPNIDGS